MYKKNTNRNAVTLLIVLAMMVMFAMLVTTFMVIVSHNRRTAEFYAKIRIEPPKSPTGNTLIGTAIRYEDDLDNAFQILLTGGLDSIISPHDNIIGAHSILENLYGSSTTGDSIPFGGVSPQLFGRDISGKPYALRPNILAPSANGAREHIARTPGIRMNPDYTAPDYMTMFLAWNDDSGITGRERRVIPSFHRPQLVNYWWRIDSAANTPNPANPNPTAPNPTELRKYVMRPLPTDHPRFTGGNPAATVPNLRNFLTEGPWDVDNTGNGTPDGIWLDIGLSARQDVTGKWYKPLISFHIIDMEGRINVNTLSNLTHFGTPPASNINVEEYLGQNGSLDVKGTGMGPAEFAATALVPEEIITARYGESRLPGGSNGNDLRLLNGINFQAYTEGGLTADWFGFSPILFDPMGNRVTAVPQDFDPRMHLPYLMNPYDNHAFRAEDLESLVRSIMDADYHVLPRRFRNRLGTSELGGGFDAARFDLPQRRYNLGVRTSDIPVVPPLPSNAAALIALLPEEITEQRRKVNLNRLTLSDNWHIHWKENATPAEKEALLLEKVRFAQEIFYLLRLLFPEKTAADDVERLAQWSVNLVDFIDPDDVMTPFIFQSGTLTPFDNAALTERLLAGTLTAADLSRDRAALIWGFEKSEVVISETFAVHDRKVEYFPNQYGPGGDWWQTEYPQGSFFVELYRRGNPHRNNQASSLVDTVDAANVLDLAKRTGGVNAGDYVWRLAIGEAVKTNPGEFNWDAGDKSKNALYQLLTPDNNDIKYPQFYQWYYADPADGAEQYRPDLGMPERFVWFGQNRPTSGQTTELENQRRSFYNWQGRANPGTSRQYVSLLPDTSLVLVPAESSLTSVSFALESSPSLPKTISLNNIGWTNASITLDNPTRQVLLNVSEPLPRAMSVPGYPPPSTMIPGVGVTPYDTGANGTILPQRGTIPCYKTICLQRLADPGRPHHPIGNPYITVDWNMIDLHVINTKDPGPDHDETLPHENTLRFVSRQAAKPASDSNIWDRTLPKDTLTANDSMAGLVDVDGEEFHTFGEHGFETPYLHFPWHDAPLMNSGELMLVPASAPGRFGVEFHDQGTASPFFADEGGNESSRFSYNGISPYDREIALRLLDYAHVPSRFAGTIQEWTAEGLPVYSMREPGKFNLNTITKAGWEALANGRSNFPTYDQFRRLRQWWSSREGTPGAGTPDDYPSEFRPFRSPAATEAVPPLNSGIPADALISPPESATLFDPTLNMMNDKAANPYTALENVMRLSDVTTVRSHVFAVWITVGYFEVEHFESRADLLAEYPSLTHINTDEMFRAVYPDGYVLGTDEGLDGAALRRYRAFYLIDRSIPVNFRGEEANFTDVIIKRTLLE